MSRLIKNTISYNKKINKLSQLYNEIHEFSTKQQSPITINQLLNLSELSFKDRINISSNYLYNEMPIRLARRIKDLEKVPFYSNHINTISSVREWYIESFMDFRQFNIQDINKSNHFLNMIEKVYERHNTTIITMAKGIHEISRMNNHKIKNINELLNRFFISRIGIRVLLEHFIELHKNPSNNYFGIICKNTDPKRILSHVVEDALYVTIKNNNDISKINIECKEEIKFPYIANHLYYILFEIIKNGISAVNKTNNKKKIIKCTLRQDENLIEIKISDNGIGIKKEDMKKIWEYSYTTTKINLDEHFESDFSREAPISGIGYGLPMTKLLLEYFGGRIEIFSEYGKGTDVYIYIHKNGNFDEPLV